MRYELYQKLKLLSGVQKSVLTPTGTLEQCFGSGLVSNSISPVDPDLKSGSRREKRHTKVQKIKKLHVLKCCMFSFEG
jgi:hypothetical protein